MSSTTNLPNLDLFQRPESLIVKGIEKTEDFLMNTLRIGKSIRSYERFIDTSFSSIGQGVYQTTKSIAAMPLVVLTFCEIGIKAQEQISHEMGFLAKSVVNLIGFLFKNIILIGCGAVMNHAILVSSLALTSKVIILTLSNIAYLTEVTRLRSIIK